VYIEEGGVLVLRKIKTSNAFLSGTPTANVLIDCGNITAPNENLFIDCGNIV
jgi:hypothetical protein